MSSTVTAMTLTIPEREWLPSHPTLNGQPLREDGRTWIESTLEEESLPLTVFTAETRGPLKGHRWFPLTVTLAHVKNGVLIADGTAPAEFCDRLPAQFTARTHTWCGKHQATVTRTSCE